MLYQILTLSILSLGLLLSGLLTLILWKTHRAMTVLLWDFEDVRTRTIQMKLSVDLSQRELMELHNHVRLMNDSISTRARENAKKNLQVSLG
jgi:hypothetical protein